MRSTFLLVEREACSTRRVPHDELTSSTIQVDEFHKRSYRVRNEFHDTSQRVPQWESMSSATRVDDLHNTSPRVPQHASMSIINQIINQIGLLKSTSIKYVESSCWIPHWSNLSSTVFEINSSFPRANWVHRVVYTYVCIYIYINNSSFPRANWVHPCCLTDI